MKAQPLDIDTADDGLTAREAGPWTRVKLEIVARYLPAFGQACSLRTPGWFYVDGFAGPGINYIRDSDPTEFVCGSPLLALKAEPAFERCVLIELGKTASQVLKQRCLPFGNRAHVVHGDCNVELLALLEKHVPERAPCVCMLDPEGPTLAWETVAGIGEYRTGRFKVEQLILLPTYMGFLRTLPREGEPSEATVEDLHRLFGNMDWYPIYKRKQAGELSPRKAHDEYVRLYKSQLEGVGYQVLDKKVRRRGDQGGPLYYLLFATTNDAGLRIMDSTFNKVTQPYQQSFGFERETLG